jgi:hypothetical protein
MEIRPVRAIFKRAAAFLFLACCPILNAQKRQFPIAAEAWGGYSYLRFEATKFGFNQDLNLNGWNGGLSLPDLYRGFGVAADISGHYTPELLQYNFLIGPQYSFELKGLRLSGHGLIGKARTRLRQPGTTNLEPSDLHKAFAFGGDVDIPLGSRFSFRAIQADYMISNAFVGSQYNLRLSTGLIVRFGKR